MTGYAASCPSRISRRAGNMGIETVRKSHSDSAMVSEDNGGERQAFGSSRDPNTLQATVYRNRSGVKDIDKVMLDRGEARLTAASILWAKVVPWLVDPEGPWHPRGPDLMNGEGEITDDANDKARQGVDIHTESFRAQAGAEEEVSLECNAGDRHISVK
ncbi:hypothetical protein LTR37_014331 [Vermiconidia calcicola]|uniref:Uncharacterized protein n=1 Tax=Vermiconidia calcicola TaxID=1690605 RepID=A0ACC3MU49_9PEZI|nr:hypothetical protein LTR37_014331 [Vermiconidia calcicola]